MCGSFSMSTGISATGDQHFSKMRSNLAYKLHIVMQPSNLLLLTITQSDLPEANYGEIEQNAKLDLQM
jgi:hypothetical protein